MLTNEQLERIVSIEYSNDCSARVIREMASELLQKREKIDSLINFVEEVRKSGDTRLASMAIAVLNINNDN